MVTDAGTTRAVFVDRSVTVAAAGVAAVNVSEQVPPEPATRVTGEHVIRRSEDGAVDRANEKVTADCPT
jgi:hypothetical protein